MVFVAAFAAHPLYAGCAWTDLPYVVASNVPLHRLSCPGETSQGCISRGSIFPRVGVYSAEIIAMQVLPRVRKAASPLAHVG